MSIAVHKDKSSPTFPYPCGILITDVLLRHLPFSLKSSVEPALNSRNVSRRISRRVAYRLVLPSCLAHIRVCALHTDASRWQTPMITDLPFRTFPLTTTLMYHENVDTRHPRASFPFKSVTSKLIPMYVHVYICPRRRKAEGGWMWEDKHEDKRFSCVYSMRLTSSLPLSHTQT